MYIIDEPTPFFRRLCHSIPWLFLLLHSLLILTYFSWLPSCLPSVRVSVGIRSSFTGVERLYSVATSISHLFFRPDPSYLGFFRNCTGKLCAVRTRADGTFSGVILVTSFLGWNQVVRICQFVYCGVLCLLTYLAKEHQRLAVGGGLLLACL